MFKVLGKDLRIPKEKKKKRLKYFLKESETYLRIIREIILMKRKNSICELQTNLFRKKSRELWEKLQSCYKMHLQYLLTFTKPE